jgi:hypothetical protein
MNTPINHKTKMAYSFKNSLVILLLVCCCFNGLLKGQTSSRGTTAFSFLQKGYTASNDLPDAYDPHRKLRKAGNGLREHPIATKTVKLIQASSDKLKLEVVPNACTQKLKVNWEGGAPSANFTLVNTEGQVMIPGINILKGSRLEFDLPRGDYLILLQMEGNRYTQRISVY